MTAHADFRRVILVVLDGLRPDAIDAFDLGHIRGLMNAGAATLRATTVEPSLTWPAITSLLCGVPPGQHGILADSLHIPRPTARLSPLPDVLARAGFPTSAFMGAIPLIYRGVASRIARGLGFAEARFAGDDASAVCLTARSAIRVQRRGLIFLHLADADRAGHEHGWMSPEYGAAARRLDAAIGAIAAEAGIYQDGQTVLVALADHGGGGGDLRHHEDAHPLNATIPLAFVGGGIRQLRLDTASLLDVPPTIAAALGIAPPDEYTGRVLAESFSSMARPATVSAVA